MSPLEIIGAAGLRAEAGPAEPQPEDRLVRVGRRHELERVCVERLGRSECGELGRVVAGCLECDPRMPSQLVGGLPGETRVLERARVVVRSHLREVRRAIRSEGGDPVAGDSVFLRPTRSRDLPVGDVADEYVREGVLGLVCHRRVGLSADEALALELGDPCLDRLAGQARELLERAHPELLADDGCVLEHGLRLASEDVEPGGDQRMDGLGQRQLSLRRSLDEHPRVLLRVERVAARLREQPRPDLPGHGHVRQQRPQELDRRFRRQRLDALDARPVRAPLEELGSRSAKQCDRCVAAPLDDVLQEIEEPVVGPLEIFHGEHEEAAQTGDTLDEPTPGGERLAAIAGLTLQAHERAEVTLDPARLLSVPHDGLHRRLEALGGNIRSVRLEDSRLRLDDLGKRPEREPCAVRETPSAPPDERLAGARQGTLQLDEEPGLADTGIPHERHRLERPARPGALDPRPQVLHLAHATE